jgi:GT2 family glycosyltransferase
MLQLAKNISQLEHKENLLQEVIIVNNNSTEDYAELKNYIDKTENINFRYFESKENLGVSRGRNFAIAQANAPLLLMLDDDCELEGTKALIKIENLFNDNSTLGLVSIKVVYFENNKIQRNTFPHKQYDKYKDIEKFKTYYFAGGAHIVRKEVIDQVGPYPIDFFYGMEEYDLSYRILNAGYTIEYNSSITMRHKESAEGRQPKKEKLQGMWLNKSKVAWKYLPFYYFISTSILWSFFYLKNTKFDFLGFIKTWAKIYRIPREIIKSNVSRSTMQYLQKVEARLWY